MSWSGDQKICQAAECERSILAKGLCSGHYIRLRKWGELRPEIPLQERVHAKGQICITEGCSRPVRSKSRCNAHYDRWRLTGDDRSTQPIKPIRYDWDDECLIENCSKQARKLGRCETHYSRLRVAGTDDRPGMCDVCETVCSVVWDHCHNNGNFRGWLCHGCNIALGSVKDNPEVLRALADYLENQGVRV